MFKLRREILCLAVNNFANLVRGRRVPCTLYFSILLQLPVRDTECLAPCAILSFYNCLFDFTSYTATTSHTFVL
jgi:hypothetical protein